MMVYSCLADLQKIGLNDVDDIRNRVKSCLSKVEQNLKNKDGFEGDISSVWLKSVVVSLHQANWSMLNLALSDKSFLESWLVYCNNESSFHPDFTTVDVLSALMLPAEGKILGQCLRLLSKCALKAPHLTPYIFPVVLHKYSKSHSEQSREIVLDTVPQLATHRLVTPQILKFLLALTKSPKTKCLSITLLGELWRRQERTFDKIKDVLNVAKTETDIDFIRRKLRVVKMVCFQRRWILTSAGSRFGQS